MKKWRHQIAMLGEIRTSWEYCSDLHSAQCPSVIGALRRLARARASKANSFRDLLMYTLRQILSVSTPRSTNSAAMRKTRAEVLR